MAEAVEGESFRVRVEKIFGSLTTQSSNNQKPASSLQSTLWSLTGDKVEKREWRRDSDASERDEIPCAASFDEMSEDLRRRRRRRRRNRMNWSEEELVGDLNDLDDDDEDEDDDNGKRDGDDGSEEWEIRSSIGLDSTLDNEEEEDEYDKVASGRENAGERMYMKSVKDQGSHLNFHNVITANSLSGGARDPRANHLAAETMLREDEAEGSNLNSNHECDTAVKKVHVNPTEHNGQGLRSILKRRTVDSDLKSSKRVRFDPSCKIPSKEDVSVVDVTDEERGIVSSWGASSGVPDYIRNPSKYTHYSFDSSAEVDERTNTQAYMEFLKLVQSSKPTELESEPEGASAGPRKTVTFIPKKKPGEVKAVNDSKVVEQPMVDDSNQSLHQTGFPVGIAAGESQELEVDAMEEDGAEANDVDKVAGIQKPGRRYRTKSRSDDFDP